MTLADTGKAMGKVTELVQQHLDVRTGVSVTVGRPEPEGPTNSLPKPRLNLFLYEATFDPGLKNTPLDEGQRPPLWLVLKYLITSFDKDGLSDTIEAHENLGLGLRALQELSYLPLGSIALPADLLPALEDNPEVLKITFDEASSDLLSKLMQGSEEKYRFSMTFQVRPVMIATGEPPDYSLLVGIDYTETPPDVIGEAGVQLPVLPSMGPSISGLTPIKFEVGEILTIRGVNLEISGLAVSLGPADLPVTAQRPDWLQCEVDGVLSEGALISAGTHPLAVVEVLTTGRRRSSNLLVAALRPTLEKATPNALHTVTGPPSGVAGNIEMEGILLGSEADDIFVALYREGEVRRVFDGPFTYAPDQKSLTLEIQDASPVDPGDYRVILRVNGQQAKKSPGVTLST
ncbi:MAG: DUF4255 domain-containing protein [Anaerolineales bacterium]|nr:DUF4255 domain-containing protein [Anaerolineales bacterium]